MQQIKKLALKCIETLTNSTNLYTCKDNIYTYNESIIDFLDCFIKSPMCEVFNWNDFDIIKYENIDKYSFLNVCTFLKGIYDKEIHIKSGSIAKYINNGDLKKVTERFLSKMPKKKINYAKQVSHRYWENLINEVYPGLTLFVRDVNLNPKLIKKYKINKIIREKTFCDASYKVGGMITNLRYAILSNHMTNIEQFEHGTNWGLCIAQRDSHFKILDICSSQGKTQILLLHLPDDERWELFKDTKLNLDSQIINDANTRFLNKCNDKPISELVTKEWLSRCSLPLGMTEEGKFWTLDVEE